MKNNEELVSIEMIENEMQMDKFLDHYHCAKCGEDGDDVNKVGTFYASFRVDKEGVIEYVLCPLCAAHKQDQIMEVFAELLK